ncbi:AfsR/SARP family transcriptional regulator [Saccharothrix isguenensis]
MSVLGPVRAWLGEVEPALGPTRRRTVFALLAGRANQVVSRDELVDGVWGDEPPMGAVGSLHTYVSGLRRALGSAREALVSRNGGYLLRLAEAALDAEVFERGRVEAQRLLAADDWSGARAAVDAALGLWKGAAYSGASGPFAEQERRRLGELRLSALELRCRAALESGQHAEVVAEVTALLVEHPWHESLRALLMLALHRAGRDGEALEVFRNARRALIEHQGIEPGSALRDAHRIVLAELSPRRAARAC